MKNNWYKNLFIIVNILLYLVTIALWISIPDMFRLNLTVSTIAILLTAILIIIYRKEFYLFYTSSYFRGFTKSFISAALALSILGFLNYLSFKHQAQWDVTANKKNSLTDQSTKILKSLKDKLKLTVFSKKSEYTVIQALLNLYRLDKADIDLNFVDIEVRPELVNKHEIDKSGTVLVEYGKKSQKVTSLSELNITNAIIRVSREKDPVIFYSTGHSELNLNNKENEGGSYIKELLGKGNYDLREIKLSSYSELPTFISALIIWGPREGFHRGELSVIEDYLRKGGRLMVALDPNVDHDRVPDLRALLSKWGVEIKNNLVVDKLKHINGSNGSVPMLDNYNPMHPITKEFKGQIFFPLVSSVGKSKEIGIDGKLSLLGQSSSFPASWGETSLDEFVSGAITFNKNKDLKGPLGLVAAWQGAGTATRMILVGNSTFVINTYRKFTKNFSFFINGLSWLVDQERLISFNLPVVKDEPVFISKPQLGIIFYFSVIFAPLGLIIMSVLIYRRRIKL